MRKRRLLLASTALSTMAFGSACGKTQQPELQPPGNPKGAVYDAPDAAKPQDPLPMPGNPKGSRYDEATPQPTPLASSAPDGGAPGKDAGAPKKK